MRHIVPSFFNLLKYLQDEELDFTLVFRTFGSDLADVAEELNLFATGQHPSHPVSAPLLMGSYCRLLTCPRSSILSHPTRRRRFVRQLTQSGCPACGVRVRRG